MSCPKFDAREQGVPLLEQNIPGILASSYLLEHGPCQNACSSMCQALGKMACCVISLGHVLFTG